MPESHLSQCREKAAKRRVMSGAVLLIGAVGLGVVWQAGLLERPPADPTGAIAACEEITRASLASTTYRRTWADFTSREPLSQMEMAEWQSRGKCTAADEAALRCARSEIDMFLEASSRKLLRDLDRKVARGAALTDFEQSIATTKRENTSGPTVKTGFVLLEYEAQNPFGANQRAFSICRFGPIGRDNRFDAGDIFQHGPVPLEEGQAAKDEYRRLENGKAS